MYYWRWWFQPELKQYYCSEIGAFLQFSGVNKKKSLKSPPIHFPVLGVYFSGIQLTTIPSFHHSASIAFLNPQPPTLPKAWKICTMDCGGIVFATMFSSEDHLNNHLGATISEFVVLCIPWRTNMLGFKNQYDEVMSLRVQETVPFAVNKNMNNHKANGIWLHRGRCAIPSSRDSMKRDAVANHTFPEKKLTHGKR